MTFYLKADQLAQQNQDEWLFHSLNFELGPQQALWIQGANGSGKSTLLKILAGILIPTIGKVYWNNCELARCWDKFTSARGFIGHALGLRSEMSVIENLHYLLALDQRHVSAVEIQNALHKVSLETKGKTRVNELSFGQQRRVNLARIALSNKLLWILDEPLAGLDHEGINLVHSILAEHLQRASLIVTGHQPLSLTGKEIFRLNLTASGALS